MSLKSPLNLSKFISSRLLGKVTERTELGNTPCEFNFLISVTPSGTTTSFNPPEYLKRTLSLMSK